MALNIIPEGEPQTGLRVAPTPPRGLNIVPQAAPTPTPGLNVVIDPERPEEVGLGRQLLAAGVRIVPPIIGGLVGSALIPAIGPAAPYLGASAGAALGEAVGQKIEGGEGSYPRIGIAAATGLIPGVRVPFGAAGTAAVRALEGGGINAAATRAEQYFEGRPADYGQIARSAGLGSLVGGGLGALEGGVRSFSRTIEDVRANPPAQTPPEQARYGTEQYGPEVPPAGGAPPIVPPSAPPTGQPREPYRPGMSRYDAIRAQAQLSPMAEELLASAERGALPPFSPEVRVAMHELGFDDATINSTPPEGIINLLRQRAGGAPEAPGAQAPPEVQPTGAPQGFQAAPLSAYFGAGPIEPQFSLPGIEPPPQRPPSGFAQPGDAETLFRQGTGEPGIRPRPLVPPAIEEGPDGIYRLSSDRPDTLTAESVRLNPLTDKRRVEAEDEVTRYLDQLGIVDRARIDEARRSRIPDSVTQAEGDQLREMLAAQLAANPEDAARIRNRGEALGDTKTRALAQLNRVAAAERVLAEQDADRFPVGTPEREAANYRTLQAGMLSADLYEQATGNASELGRAFRQLRMVIEEAGGGKAFGQSGQSAVTRAIRYATKQFGGQANYDQIIKDIRAFGPDQTAELNQYMASPELVKGSFGEKLHSLRDNFLLFGIPGRAVDVASNALFLERAPLELALTGAAERLRTAGRLKGPDGEFLRTPEGGYVHPPKEHFVGQAVAHLAGQAATVLSGARAALKTLAMELPSSGTSRLVDPGLHRAHFEGPTIISKERLQKWGAPSYVKPITLGRFIRAGSGFTEAIDEFFKPLASQGYLWSEAYKIAAMDQAAGRIANGTRAFAERAASIIDNPAQVRDLLKRMDLEALHRTWQTDIHPKLRPLQQLRDLGFESGPLRGIKPGRLIVPFFRTSVNLTRQGLGDFFSPLTYATGVLSGNIKGAAHSEAIARTMVGATITLGAMAAARRGLITGAGPIDRQELDAKRGTGWQPNTVTFGPNQFNYSRLDPVGLTIGTAADISEVWPMLWQEDALFNAAQIGANAVKSNIWGKTWAKGMSDFMEAQNDFKRYGAKYLASQAASFLVPVGAAQLSKAIDPTVRSARLTKDEDANLASFLPKSLGIELRARTGALPTLLGYDNAGTKVLPIRDMWGEEVIRPGGFVERFASPFRRSQIYSDPASTAVRELGFAPGSPARFLKEQGIKYDFSDAEYDRYTQETGQFAKRLVSQTVASPRFRALMGAGDQGKEAARDLLAHDFREAAKIARQRIRGGVIRRGRAEAAAAR